MNERQYPIRLRRIGEPEIADYLESLVIEIDTHEKMFLELCQVKRERDALLAGVPKWISVDAEQKPMHGKEYLCVCSLPDDPMHEWDWLMVLRWYADGGNGYVDRPHFTDEGVNGMTVTHWMSLPELPKTDPK